MDQNTFTLPASQRLRSAMHFESVFKSGERLQGKYMRLIYTPAKFPKEKVAFACPKKVGKAPIRNRAKRRVREAYRLHQSLFTLPIDIIFFAKFDASKAPFEAIVAELKYLASKLPRE
jgi:ribonuclease P protein component